MANVIDYENKYISRDEFIKKRARKKEAEKRAQEAYDKTLAELSQEDKKILNLQGTAEEKKKNIKVEELEKEKADTEARIEVLRKRLAESVKEKGEDSHGAKISQGRINNELEEAEARLAKIGRDLEKALHG